MSLALTALSAVTLGQALRPAAIGGVPSATAAAGTAGFVAPGKGGGSFFSVSGGRSVPREWYGACHAMSCIAYVAVGGWN